MSLAAAGLQSFLLTDFNSEVRTDADVHRVSSGGKLWAVDRSAGLAKAPAKVPWQLPATAPHPCHTPVGLRACAKD